MRYGVRSLWMAACAAAVGLLAGCGNSPPTGEVKAAIEKAMIDGRQGVEAKGVSLAGWENKDIPGLFNTTWTGKLKLKEDHAYVVAVVDGKNIVKVVAKAGDELEMSGNATAAKPEGVKDWSCGAFADADKAWAKIAEKEGPITMGYPAISSDGGQTTKFRSGLSVSDNFLPLSSFKPYIVQGSDEDKKLGAELMEKQRKAQEAYQAQLKARQDALAAQQAQQKAQQEELQRKAAEKAAADQKAREEAAKQAAEAARVARLTPVLAPFKGGKGAVVVTDAGQELGAFLYEATLDEANFKVTGKGLDLREMPFKEFTFECTATDTNGRATFSYARAGADPVALAPVPGGGLGARGVSLASLDDAARAKLDALVSTGRQLGAAAPAGLSVEVLDANAAKARQMDMQTDALAGTVIYKGKNAPQFAALFTPAGTRGNLWKAEPLAIRVKEPVRAKGILIKGVNPCDNLMVVINGVHKARVDAIAKGGAAIVSLPADLDVMEVRIEAVGTVSARGVVLIK